MLVPTWLPLLLTFYWLWVVTLCFYSPNIFHYDYICHTPLLIYINIVVYIHSPYISIITHWNMNLILRKLNKYFIKRTLLNTVIWNRLFVFYSMNIDIFTINELEHFIEDDIILTDSEYQMTIVNHLLFILIMEFKLWTHLITYQLRLYLIHSSNQYLISISIFVFEIL